MSRPSRLHRDSQGGFLLLEVLVAVLIFAIGVLSIVGLQVASVKQSGDAKMRADATLLANNLIGRMWVGDRSFAALTANYGAGGPAIADWLAVVDESLPGVVLDQTDVVVEAVAAGASGVAPSSRVTVVISWRAPNEPDDEPVHNVTIVTQIR